MGSRQNFFGQRQRRRFGLPLDARHSPPPPTFTAWMLLMPRATCLPSLCRTYVLHKWAIPPKSSILNLTCFSSSSALPRAFTRVIQSSSVSTEYFSAPLHLPQR